MRYRHSVLACALIVVSPLTHAVIACGDGMVPPPARAAVVQVPDYVAADDAPDVVAQRIWSDYQTSLFETLSHSPEPRDWALATLLTPLSSPAGGSSPENTALLQRAMRAAPNDGLVQWIAMTRGEPTHDAALRALHTLEPDNAAVWNEALIVATRAKDDARIDAALAKMSAAHRFDVHYADLLKAAAEVFLRNPVPDTYLAAASNDDAPGKEDSAYVTAMTITAAVALPAFQQLVNACRIDPTSNQNSPRAADCAAIGRLMTSRGDTLIANRIGAVVLRVSRTYTDDDVQAARNVDWVFDKAALTWSPGTNSELARDFVVRYHDWTETGSEIESIRRALARRDIALTPPDDWVDNLSTFSAERLREDAARFEKSAAK